MKRIILGLFFAMTVAWAWAAPSLQNGDLVFLTEKGDFAKAIQLATHSPYNHVGMIFLQNGRPYVFEAVGPVQFTPLEEFAKRGIGGRYDVKRLKKAEKILTPKVLKKMRALAKKFQGRAYSGAFDWLDDKMYCSELVWKVYQRTTGLEIGKLKKLRDFDLTHPLVKKELEARFGGFIPPGLKIISPGAMAESGLLEAVDLRTVERNDK